MARKTKTKAVLIRARQQQALSLYAKGMTPDQIALQLNMRVKEVNFDVAAAMDRLLTHFTVPPQQTFIRYAVFNLDIIRKLQRAVERFQKDTKSVQYNSVIAALRAQSDIYDRILDKGLAFGVVERKKASKAARAPQDIRKLLKTEIRTLTRLLDEVDMSISFRARRARVQVQEVAQVQVVPIIIKPQVGPHGVIKVVPDWKYPRKPYTRRSDGKAVEASLDKLTPQQQEHFKLAQEITALTTVIEGQPKKRRKRARVIEAQAQPVQQTQDTPLPAPAKGSTWLVPPKAPQPRES